MAIIVKMHDEKWRLGITETWEFETKEDMEAVFKTILDKKDKYGRLKKTYCDL